MIAKELGAELYRIHYLKHEAPLYAPIKYFLQAARTLQTLALASSEVVFVQTPPFVCSLVVYLYCRITGGYFILDHHSAAFSPIWDWAVPIRKFLARRAITNIVTNQHWADLVHSWSAEVFILTDPLRKPSEIDEFKVGPGFNVAFINTFSSDEPLEAVLEAASQLPNVHFYITGGARRHPANVITNVSKNVIFTGFLPRAQYFGLLSAVQAVMSLTTRNHTLQGGGFEAASLGKPLITSDWPYLKGLFPKGSIYVSNSSESIRYGVLKMQEKYKVLEKEMSEFYLENRRGWDMQFLKLKKIIANHLSGSCP